MGYAKGRATRLDIIEQATALFGESGYRGTSLREIAGRCGISHPGLLHHFPTKQSLLLAVLEHRDEADRQAAGDVTGVQALRTLVDLAARNARRRGIVELFTVLSAEATAADHPAHEFFVTRYRRVVGELQEAYAEAAAAGHLNASVVPPDAAAEFVALMDGLQIQWLLSDGALDMAAILGRHLENQLTASSP